jgi:hypothetical protein
LRKRGDVFFLTADQIVPQDTDTQVDISGSPDALAPRT